MSRLFTIIFFVAILTSDCLAQTYKYDAANRLVQISSNCAGTKYDYDANGNRTAVTQVSIETISSLFGEKCGNDGKILITPHDSTIHYRYLWSNGKTTDSITNLVGGTYSVEITEPTTGFTCNQIFKIKGIFKDSLSVVTQQIICNGANNGKAKIKVVTPDTVGSYLYHWSTSTDTAYTPLDSLTDLKPGIYSVSIRNTKRSCPKEISFTITEPPVIITEIKQTDASCPSVNDGAVYVSVDGNPDNYTFALTGPINGTLAGYNISGLPVGDYKLVVTQKATLCTVTRSITIGALLTDATIIPGGQTTFFTGQSVLLSANTAPLYSYQWCKNGIDIPGAVDSTYTASENGSFSVKITVGRCTLESTHIEVNVMPINNFTVSATDESCRTSNNGSIDITTVASLNYIATLSGSNINTTTYSFANSLHISNLSASNYRVCISVDGQSNYNQCYDLVIHEPQDLSVFNVSVSNTAKTVTVSLSGGTQYTVELNGHSYATTATNVTLPIITGSNHLRITADEICQGVFEREFTVSDGIVVFPNPFERSLTVSLGANTTKRIGVTIYNVVGYKVYSNTLNNEDGFITIPLPDFLKGAYTLKLSISNQVFKISRK